MFTFVVSFSKEINFVIMRELGVLQMNIMISSILLYCVSLENTSTIQQQVLGFATCDYRKYKLSVNLKTKLKTVQGLTCAPVQASQKELIPQLFRKKNYGNSLGICDHPQTILCTNCMYKNRFNVLIFRIHEKCAQKRFKISLTL